MGGTRISELAGGGSEGQGGGHGGQKKIVVIGLSTGGRSTSGGRLIAT